jgi:hypothetical protein
MKKLMGINVEVQCFDSKVSDTMEKQFLAHRIKYSFCFSFFVFFHIFSFKSFLSFIFRCEEHLYKRLRPSVGRSVRWSVPHDAIMWKTSYVAIASRRGEGRGN